jgi:beta-galactosidase
VWTGFDYLGEPTPYFEDATTLPEFTDPAERARMEALLKAAGKIPVPSRSSYFGILDLAGLKKDRFYIYQARWRADIPMAHLLPHWTWPERAGLVTPVHVYTSGDEAELFLNGRSLGRKPRGPLEYRIRWDDVRYEPGELKVVAYKGGKPWASDVERTAGAAAAVALSADRPSLAADGSDLSYVTVRINDRDGTLVPRASNKVRFTLSGPGDIVAVDNGDPTSLAPFQAAEREAFNGLCIAIVRTRRGSPGRITLTAESDGLTPSTVEIASGPAS